LLSDGVLFPQGGHQVAQKFKPATYRQIRYGNRPAVLPPYSEIRSRITRNDNAFMDGGINHEYKETCERHNAQRRNLSILTVCITENYNHIVSPSGLLASKKGRQMVITRKVEFSASHICRRSDLSEGENQRLYGAAANPHGHGHNYVLEVSLQGEPDPVTGMVLDLKELKEILVRQWWNLTTTAS